MGNLWKKFLIYILCFDLIVSPVSQYFSNYIPFVKKISIINESFAVVSGEILCSSYTRPYGRYGSYEEARKSCLSYMSENCTSKSSVSAKESASNLSCYAKACEAGGKLAEREKN
jgi:hypothetical protein